MSSSFVDLGKKGPPKGWKSPLREPLYRVCVDMRGEQKPVAVTPGMVRKYADMLHVQIKQQINRGNLPDWGNPTVVLCSL